MEPLDGGSQWGFRDQEVAIGAVSLYSRKTDAKTGKQTSASFEPRRAEAHERAVRSFKRR
jgi:hypothetical protein